MLIPTNDGFFALNGVAAPEGKKTLTLFAPAYDAGSERNDELCASIPGPNFAECGGPGGGAVIRALGRRPFWLFRGGMFLIKKLWSVRKDLWKARGPTGKITFFIQNFMDADNLDPERIRNCSFMVMTDRGPVSMCEHNARRDDFILKPLSLPTLPSGRVLWDPLSGHLRRPGEPPPAAPSNPSVASGRRV